MVRYADTAGENTDRPLPHAWRYRNWVCECFNNDMPFDEFVRLQLAGDLIRSGSSREQLNEGIIATGYLAIARRYGHDIDKRAYLMYEDVIDNLGKNFLGLTTGCARCHDHKYDPIPMQDYYALYGIFESTRFAFPGCEPKGQPRDLVPLISQAEISRRMKPWNEKVARAKSVQARISQVTEQLKSLKQNAVRLVVPRTQVNEGATVPIGDIEADLKKGEVLQLTVFPNASHGADTTRIQWKIHQAGGMRRSWDVEDLIATFTRQNPLTTADDANWCFLETTNGPEFLTRAVEALPENAALKAWKRADDALAVFVNTADQPVKVWTTLPAKSLFVHPEINRPVAIAFVSPIDGKVRISGSVIDAHPAGGDGVSFEMTHIKSDRFGKSLLVAGRLVSQPAPDPGPKPDVPVAYAVADSTPVDARLQKRGDPEQPGDVIPRRWLTVFGGTPLGNPRESGRRELADWIAQHPLTARVMVNRIWQWHFGRGLVQTPNNFGFRGDPPSHPELLDWLAKEFVASGFRVKHIHRMIMQTAAYKRSSELSPHLVEVDPANRLLARFSRRRLTAEEIRDSLLKLSGNLDPTPARAHPFPPESTWRFTQHNPFHAVYRTNRRSVFLMVQRQRRHPFLALFDGADPNASTPVRQTSTVPTQALYFLNDPFFHEQAVALVQRLPQKTDQTKRMDQLYQIVFQRNPTARERGIGSAFLNQYPAEPDQKWAALARILLSSNEFIFVD